VARRGGGCPAGGLHERMLAGRAGGQENRGAVDGVFAVL